MNENQIEQPITFSYGGQAVIEGVMMRGTRIAAIAVRDIEGKVVLHEQALNATLYRGRISKMPFVRGVIGLWDALGLCTRALMWSADIALGEEEVNFNGPLGWGTVFISLLLGIKEVSTWRISATYRSLHSTKQGRLREVNLLLRMWYL